MSLSDRIRAGSEAAPWVIADVKALEAELASWMAASKHLRRTMRKLRFDNKTLQEQRRAWLDHDCRASVMVQQETEIETLKGQLAEAQTEVLEQRAMREDWGIDLRLWSIDAIVSFLEDRAKLCEKRDQCSLAPTEISYCATSEAVEALKAKLASTDADRLELSRTQELVRRLQAQLDAARAEAADERRVRENWQAQARDCMAFYEAREQAYRTALETHNAKVTRAAGTNPLNWWIKAEFLIPAPLTDVDPGKPAATPTPDYPATQMDAEGAVTFSPSSTGERPDCAALEDEIQRLQQALAFWLPSAPPEHSPFADRVEHDAWLLAGYGGELERSAEELGWLVRPRPGDALSQTTLKFSNEWLQRHAKTDPEDEPSAGVEQALSQLMRTPYVVHEKHCAVWSNVVPGPFLPCTCRLGSRTPNPTGDV